MSRGHSRERQVKLHLEERDYVVVRAAGSLGPVDVIAVKPGDVRFIEVKSTAQGPYERFSPADREHLIALAELAGASAWLAWWPPRGSLRFIPASEWPKRLRAA